MTFKDLKIYQKSIKLEKEIQSECDSVKFYKQVIKFDQILRSSKSIAANIAEGFGKRMYPKELIRYLNIALGSSDETQHHIQSLSIQRILSEEKRVYFTREYKNLSVKILNFIKAIKQNNLSEKR